MHNFDGTNPLLEALGDEPEIKEITLTNSSAFIIVEPLTQVRLQPFEKTVIQVIGNAAYEHIMANINQLNALKSDVISIETSEPEDGESGNANNWELTNAELSNGALTYTGGSVDFGFIFGTEKAFGLSKRISTGYCYAYDLPTYLVDAVNPFAEITTMISSHQNLSQAFQNRNQPICAYTSDFTTDNGENTGLRVGFTSRSGGVMNDFEISNQRLNIKAAVAESTFTVFARDLDTNATQAHTTNVVGLLDQPMYLHVLVRLRSPAADGLSNDQFNLSFQEIFGEA